MSTPVQFEEITSEQARSLYMRVTRAVEIVYTNWRRETAVRLVVPMKIWFGSTPYHPDEQWLMKALDVEKNEERDFAMKDIKVWLGRPRT